MEDFLTGRFAICKKEVDALAPETRVAETRGRCLTNTEHLSAVFRFKTCEVGGVRPGNDEHVALGDRLDVHECDCPRVFTDDACLTVPGNESAEEALAGL